MFSRAYVLLKKQNGQNGRKAYHTQLNCYHVHTVTRMNNSVPRGLFINFHFESNVTYTDVHGYCFVNS